MPYDINDTYLEEQVMSASPLGLVRILFGAATEAVLKARAHLAAGDIRERSREIGRAAAIVTELAGSLDRERGGDLAHRLADLYGYIGRRLLEANHLQQDEPLAECLSLLTTLREAFDTIQTPEDAPPAAYSEVSYAGSQTWSA